MEIVIPKASELTEEELRKTKEIPRYPEIDNTEQSLEHWSKSLVTPYNIPLDIELKRDGSNLRLFHISGDRYGLMSRNQYAADNFINKVLMTVKMPYDAKYKDSNHNATHEGLFTLAKNGYIVYFEFFGKGIFPGYDYDSPPSMEVLDLLTKDSGLLRRKAKAVECFKARAPVVPVLKSNFEVKGKDAYWAIVRPLVDMVYNEMHKEGIVIKGFIRNYGQVLIKEKHPEVLKSADKQRHEITTGELVVDTRLYLDQSEINGAIKKVHTEIGDKIFTKEIAMPSIAGKVAEECRKHDRKFPQTIWKDYLHYLEQIKNMPSLMSLEDIE